VIVAVAVVPTAPLLVPGVNPRLPPPLRRVAAAVAAALDGLPPADVALLVTVGEPAVASGGVASLAGAGRPDIAQHLAGDEAAARAFAAVGGFRDRPGPLPLGAAVLGLLGRLLVPTAAVAAVAGSVSLTVSDAASFADLSALGAGIVGATEARVVLLAAGDLAAGLTERAPLHRVPGAQAWDERAVAVVDSGRMGGLARLGPDEARRVGALGWAPMAVVHGVCARAKVGVVLRHYSAPRGVGYLVAAGA
jgi:hypothetical protein